MFLKWVAGILKKPLSNGGVSLLRELMRRLPREYLVPYGVAFPPPAVSDALDTAIRLRAAVCTWHRNLQEAIAVGRPSFSSSELTILEKGSSNHEFFLDQLRAVKDLMRQRERKYGPNPTSADMCEGVPVSGTNENIAADLHPGNFTSSTEMTERALEVIDTEDVYEQEQNMNTSALETKASHSLQDSKNEKYGAALGSLSLYAGHLQAIGPSGTDAALEMEASALHEFGVLQTVAMLARVAVYGKAAFTAGMKHLDICTHIKGIDPTVDHGSFWFRSGHERITAPGSIQTAIKGYLQLGTCVDSFMQQNGGPIAPGTSCGPQSPLRHCMLQQAKVLSSLTDDETRS